MLKGKSNFFRIDSKNFSLVFDGGRFDSFSITERRGQFHGSIRMGRLGLDWIIACLTESSHWDFRKKKFYKCFRESYKSLEITSRSNKGGLFVEISEYYNGVRRGCLRAPEFVKKAG